MLTTAVQNEKITGMIQDLLNNPNVSDHSKNGFIKSISEYYSKKSALTEGQYMALVRMHESYAFFDPEWRNNFSEEKRKIFDLCCKYYNDTPYYGNIRKKRAIDSNYIPSEKEYKAMCENKYAKVFIREYYSPPKYELGSMVRMRKNLSVGIGNVLEFVPEKTAAVAGGKAYRVYFGSTGLSLILQERVLASVRECDFKKIEEATQSISE